MPPEFAALLVSSALILAGSAGYFWIDASRRQAARRQVAEDWARSENRLRLEGYTPAQARQLTADQFRSRR